MSKIVLPFAGFYESRWSGIADWYVEHESEFEAEGRDGEIPEPLRTPNAAGDLWERVDYKAWETALSRSYADALAKRVAEECDLPGFALSFESLDSPRFYNYDTDRIFCDISDSDVSRLVAAAQASGCLETVARERHESRSGFSSFYDPDVSTWNLSELDHNQLCTMLIAALGGSEAVEAIERDIYEDLAEDAHGNCRLDQYIDWEAHTAAIKAERLTLWEALTPEQQAECQQAAPDLVQDLLDTVRATC